MRRRKEGFSLVELLIVLAVIAALIATITPVAMNAIRKANATKVAQNLKSLGTAFENYAYVNGTIPTAITDLGRDIDTSLYSVWYVYDEETGECTVTAAASEDVNFIALQEVLPSVSEGASVAYADDSSFGENITDGFFYNLYFQVY
jgi:general secretion pathway protein G